MMLQIVTDAVVSRGYDGAPAIYTSEDGQFISFRVGHKVYDTRAPNNTRWVNLNVNITGDLIPKIQKMNLKEGSHINIFGNFDMRPNVNRENGEITTWPTIKASHIEFAASRPKQEPAKPLRQNAEPANATSEPEQPADFLGYMPFGEDTPYYPE